jgi:hypothetical protein
MPAEPNPKLAPPLNPGTLERTTDTARRVAKYSETGLTITEAWEAAEEDRLNDVHEWLHKGGVK